LRSLKVVLSLKQKKKVQKGVQQKGWKFGLLKSLLVLFFFILFFIGFINIKFYLNRIQDPVWIKFYGRKIKKNLWPALMTLSIPG